MIVELLLLILLLIFLRIFVFTSRAGRNSGKHPGPEQKTSFNMEKLPDLALEKIIRQLTPQDLARCSAVCQEWRELFNQDWMWRPHCDPELEEPLQTIPSVVTPAFVPSEEDDSTLPLLCRWRLAFMREKHLWKNWRKVDDEDLHRTGKKDDCLINVDFLTNTLVVGWYTDRIEILDVGVKPPVSWAKLYTSVGDESGEIDERLTAVIGGDKLIVEKELTVEVYNVDVANKSIKLQHSISVEVRKKHIVKEHSCIFTWEEKTSKINIYDLNTGKILKEETLSPVFPQIKENETVKLEGTASSSTSDFAVLCFIVQENIDRREQFHRFFDLTNDLYKLHVFNMKQLIFLPDVVINVNRRDSFTGININHRPDMWCALHYQWLAYSDQTRLVVYNLESNKILDEVDDEVFQVFGCDNSFVFSVFSESMISSFVMCLKSYSPIHKTLRTLGTLSLSFASQILPNKLFLVYEPCVVSLWKFPGEKMKCHELKFDGVKGFIKYKTNQSCTIIVIHRNYPAEDLFIKYCW